MKQKTLSLIKIFQFITITTLIIVALVFIIKYSSNHNVVNITRLPFENSRLNDISVGYANKKTEAHHITKSYKAHKELFAIDDLQKRREFLIDYFNIPRSTLYIPTVGDPLVAKRFELILQETALNGLSAGESFLTRLSSASGLPLEEVQSLLTVTKYIESPDSFLKHYPNLASIEWEFFIQSQELNRVMQDFPD